MELNFITIDLDGVLYLEYPTRQQVLLTLLEEQGHDVSHTREAILWSMRYEADTHPQPIDSHAYVEQFLQALDIEPTPQRIDTLLPLFHERYQPERMLISGTKEVLWQLRSEYIQIGLVSKRRTPLTGLAIELGIIEHVNFTLSAGQVEAGKMFETALQLAGHIEPEHAAHIGSNYYADVKAAQDAGLHPIFLDRYGIYDDGTNPPFTVIDHLRELEQRLRLWT